MQNRSVQPEIVLVGFGLAYPALVYYLRDTVPSSAFIALALLLVALRIGFAKEGGSSFRPVLIAAAITLTGVAFLDAALATRTYPVLMSLSAASVFAVTLLQPVSLIERIAVARGNAWSEGLRTYCRKVTLVWTLWLILNATIAGVLAIASDDWAWALWTGFISYLISGALFAIEWLMRRPLLSRAAR